MGPDNAHKGPVGMTHGGGCMGADAERNDLIGNPFTTCVPFVPGALAALLLSRIISNGGAMRARIWLGARTPA